VSSIDPENLPQGEAKARAVQEMFDTIAPRYDLVNRIMTFRLDTRWRRRTVANLGLGPGSVVIDLACGTGDFCVDLEKAGLDAFGFDLSMGMLRAARTNAPLVHTDILRLPVADTAVDGATCGFALRNLVELPPFFAEMARVVRPGGRIGLLDVAEPENRVLRWGHHVYFDRIVPKVGGLLSDKSAYSYLPKSVAYLPDPESMIAALDEAGFVDITRRLLSPGSAQLLTATRG
jgi:demethylmenaquinone methyltransferase/2-methoxy-6-polyprenyl-1,4-benzoquinol methylase